ncbi:hypothetical protein PCH_Pc12g05650 [Penicillium rubens Wisconsin 54-1255]|uniref:Uncharacterized protein n=1 Tax=Penicillium rubens (strain ATCC 28089 / DSM 1075 / NRRL 1951 / Wisconsin 54-1255) TaxID=500485 RepID=B6GZG4_PENRW|nr:hypothetical protein PCH_Pc12g05650 [Penicillium rubens Wisconsin 54-1255]
MQRDADAESDQAVGGGGEVGSGLRRTRGMISYKKANGQAVDASGIDTLESSPDDSSTHRTISKAEINGQIISQPENRGQSDGQLRHTKTSLGSDRTPASMGHT